MDTWVSARQKPISRCASIHRAHVRVRRRSNAIVLSICRRSMPLQPITGSGLGSRQAISERTREIPSSACKLRCRCIRAADQFTRARSHRQPGSRAQGSRRARAARPSSMRARSFLGITNGIAQVRALKRRWFEPEPLASTRLGQAGGRAHASGRAERAAAALQPATRRRNRINYILSLLRLEAAIGELTETNSSPSSVADRAAALTAGDKVSVRGVTGLIGH